MRGGLDAGTIARQCSSAYSNQIKAHKIDNYAKTKGVNGGLGVCGRLSTILAQDPAFPNDFFSSI
jgi:hypothetical protein